jgi:exosome complex exonuclease DIS3/RRP44
MESHKKAFHKKTRRGKVVRLVQERYLRTDQGCGFFLSSDAKSGDGNRLSVSNIQDIVSKSPHKHLLILDTNICVHQIDLLEHDCPATANIIITQTVLAEVRHVNLGVYRRVSALLKDSKRMFIFYANHLSTETAEQRDPDESVNDFHDRSIVRCAAFYKQCLQSGQTQAKSSSGGDVVFITNDVGNCKRAKEEGIQTYNMLDYVTEFLSKDYPQLADLVACDETQAIANSHLLGSDQLVFPPHLAMDKLLGGIKTRQFLRGTIRCRGNDRSDCYILLHRKDSEERRTVLVTGHIRVNRAVDGDVVAIELVAAPENETDEQAKRMEQQLRGLEGGEERGNDAAAEGSDLQEPTLEALEGISAPAPANKDQKLSTGSKQQQATKPGEDASQLLYGRVVGVIRRNWKQYAGSLDMRETRDGGGGSTMVQFLPVNRKIPPVWISTRRIDEVAQSRLIVQIDAWPASSSLPYGHYIAVLGKAGDKAIETQVRHDMIDTT